MSSGARLSGAHFRIEGRATLAGAFLVLREILDFYLLEGDRQLLTATDELIDTKFICDNTWAELSKRWSTQQLMDIVFAVGQYTLVSMALNTFGVQLEDDTEAFPPELFVNGMFPLPEGRNR